MTEMSVEVDFENVSTQIEDEVRSLVEDANDRAFEVSQDKVPSDRGTLRMSGIPPTWANDSIQWGYNAPYARHVEFGTGPFTPPLKPLEEWGERVLGSKDAGRRVWAKIREEGIRPQPYLRPAIQELRFALSSQPLSIESNLDTL